MSGQGKGKDIVKYTSEGMRTSLFPKGQYEPLEVGRADDLSEVVKMGVQSLQGARLRRFQEPRYSPDNEGLEKFVCDCERYFERVNEINADLEEQFAVIPDHEGLCAFLGISRETFRKYRGRSREWAYSLDLVSTVITSCKKALALRGKIPSVFAIFDLANNSGYYNTNTFVPEGEPFEFVETREERLSRLIDKYRVGQGSNVHEEQRGDFSE